MDIRKYLKKIWEILTSPIGKLAITVVGLALLFYIIRFLEGYLYDWRYNEFISKQQYDLFTLIVSTIKALSISIVFVKLVNTIIKLIHIQSGKSLNYRIVTLVIILFLAFFFFQDGIFYSLFNPNQHFRENDIAFGRVYDDFVMKIRLIFEIDMETEINSTSSPISLYFKGIEISPYYYADAIEYDTICFDEILFSVSHSINSFQLNPLWGEPTVPDFDYAANLLEYVGEENFPHPDTPYCYTAEEITNLPFEENQPWYFEFPEKKDIFNYITTYVKYYELFNYPYATKDMDFAIQIIYHLENDTTKSEKRVIAPPIAIFYNDTNIWNYETTSITQQATPAQIEDDWSDGPIKIAQTSISGPTFYKMITVIILIGLYLLTGFLLFIKDDGDFVGATGAILFGVFGTKQIISPILPIAHNIIDTIIFFVYIFITMIIVERVILKIVKKQG